MNLLDVSDLDVTFSTPEGTVQAVDSLSFSMGTNEVLGIVGESGSGKTQLAYAILGLLAKNGRAKGSVRFNEKEILNLKERELNKIRSENISMVFQDPMTSLNPFLKIGHHLTEVLIKHKKISKKEAIKQSIAMLESVKIPDPKKRMNQFPHELSGGMRQRVMIALALLCNPKLLIADEPTTALDVTVQAGIITLLLDLKKDTGAAIILITHDLGIVAGACDNVLVMYGGRIMEYGSLDDIFYRPYHPYTIGLLKSVPRLDNDTEKLPGIEGNPPNLQNMPTGCPFQARCPEVMDICRKVTPPLVEFNQNRKSACHLNSKE